MHVAQHNCFGSVALRMGNIDVVADLFLKIYFVDKSWLVQHYLLRGVASANFVATGFNPWKKAKKTIESRRSDPYINAIYGLKNENT
jgi:hypothetical protein